MGCSYSQRQKALGHSAQLPACAVGALGPPLGGANTPRGLWAPRCRKLLRKETLGAQGPAGGSLRPTSRSALRHRVQVTDTAPSDQAHARCPLIRYSLLHNVRSDLWNFSQYPVITGPPRIHQACYFSANYILIYRLQPLLIGSGHQLL